MREINHTCPVCNQETMDMYMVTAECWAEAGFTYFQNVHLHCLAEVLERDLLLTDFPDVPVNFNIPQVLEQNVVALPQDRNNWVDRRADIESECQRRRDA